MYMLLRLASEIPLQMDENLNAAANERDEIAENSSQESASGKGFWSGSRPCFHERSSLRATWALARQ